MKQEELKLVISAVDQATAALRQVGESVGWLGGSVTKASIQFNAINQAARTFGEVIGTVFKQAWGAVEDFNQSVVQSAAMITGMMKEDGRPLAERYREAKTYAQQLQLVLEEIDKETLLNARDLSAMTMEMQKQGVLLDVTNAKQIEAFKALSNAVAVVSQGYPAKEVQIRQEIRSLLSGQTRATDALSGMLKAQVPDLERQIALHKEQGDLIEWLGGQLQGFAAASGDLEATWEAVKTSMETVWRQALRGAFAEPVREVVGLLKQMSEWFVEHKEQIQEGLGRAWGIVKSLVVSTWELFKTLAPLLQPALVIVQALVTAFEDIALRVIPGMVRAIADTFGKVKEFYEWLKSKTAGGEEGGDVLIGTDRSRREELTQADLQNTQRGLTVAPPKTKKPANEELQKQIEEWKKARGKLGTEMSNVLEADAVEKQLRELENTYRDYMEKFKSVPGAPAFLQEWLSKMTEGVQTKADIEEINRKILQEERELQEAIDNELAGYKAILEDANHRIDLEKGYLDLRREQGTITDSEQLQGEIDLLNEKIEAENRYIAALEAMKDKQEITEIEFDGMTLRNIQNIEKLILAVERLQNARAVRADGLWGGFQDEINRLGDSVTNLVEAGRIAAQGMAQSFRTFFFDVMTANFRSFGDLVKKLFQGVINAIAAGLADAFSKTLMKGFSSAMDSMLDAMSGLGGGGSSPLGFLMTIGKAFLGAAMGGGGFGGAAAAGAGMAGSPIFFEPFVPMTMHSGGYVTGAAPAWAVSAWQAATGARRFHLGTDEVPAILQAGEKVIPRGQSERQEPNVTIIQIHAVDSKSFDDMCQRNAASIVRQSTKALQSNQVRSLWNAYLR